MSSERKSYSDFLTDLSIEGKAAGQYYDLGKLQNQEAVRKLPISIKVRTRACVCVCLLCCLDPATRRVYMHVLMSAYAGAVGVCFAQL
jgi:hypothetical protein